MAGIPAATITRMVSEWATTVCSGTWVETSPWNSAIEEFQGDVSTHVPEHTVVAHSETILVIVAAGIPAIDGRHGAGIRSNQIRKRKDAMAIVATACCKGRNYGMAQPPKHAFTLTAVIQCVFVEGFRERIARRRSHRRDAEVGTESLAITLCALTPF